MTTLRKLGLKSTRNHQTIATKTQSIQIKQIRKVAIWSLEEVLGQTTVLYSSITQRERLLKVKLSNHPTITPWEVQIEIQKALCLEMVSSWWSRPVLADRNHHEVALACSHRLVPLVKIQALVVRRLWGCPMAGSNSATAKEPAATYHCCPQAVTHHNSIIIVTLCTHEDYHSKVTPSKTKTFREPSSFRISKKLARGANNRKRTSWWSNRITT